MEATTNSDITLVSAGMFLSMSMEEPNEPLACNVDGGRRAGSSRSNDDSSVSMPESGSSAGSEHNEAPPNGHMAAMPELHPPNASQIKRRPVSPVDDARRPSKRPKHGTSSMLLSLMQVCPVADILFFLLHMHRAGVPIADNSIVAPLICG